MFLRLITDHRKQYLPIRLLIPIFLKLSLYHVELFILMIQSRFLDIYSGPEFHFWKLIPLIVDSCERGLFNLRGGGGHFREIFQTYIFILPTFLTMHCIFVLTLDQLLHNSLHIAQAWFCELCARQCYIRFTHSPFAVRMQFMCGWAEHSFCIHTGVCN